MSDIKPSFHNISVKSMTRRAENEGWELYSLSKGNIKKICQLKKLDIGPKKCLTNGN
jgi:hypothetical protein